MQRGIARAARLILAVVFVAPLAAAAGDSQNEAERRV